MRVEVPQEPRSDIQLLYCLSRFIADYFTLEEIRMICFDLGINYENLPGDTASRKARELIIHLGNEEDKELCQDRYVALLTVFADERSAFYPDLFEGLDLDEYDGPESASELARHYCAGHKEFLDATRPLHEKALSRIGLENRVGTIIIVLILAAFALTAFLLWRQIRPDQMSGDFNLAVAPFYVLGSDQEIGHDVANSIFGRLKANFGESVLPIVEVWGPDEPMLNPVPVIKGDTDDIRDANAARLADKINADIVVYGTVIKNSAGWTVTPKFYVSPNNFENASEILGPYDLGETFGLSEGNRRALRITAGDELTPRAEFLTQVAIGLTYYSVANYDRAAGTLSSILPTDEINGSVNDESLRLVYLLLGNTLLKKALQAITTLDTSSEESIETAESRIGLLLQEAGGYFAQSAAIDPQYARAHIGLGDITLQKSLQCDAVRCDINPEMVAQSISSYEQAMLAKNSPPTAVIEAKANFGLGQAHYLESLEEGDETFAEAVGYFEAVVADYELDGAPRARDIAAEAQARLAVIRCFQGQYVDAVSFYNEAIQLYADDPAQEANRLLSRDVRNQKSELYQFRINLLESEKNPNCTATPEQNKP